MNQQQITVQGQHVSYLCKTAGPGSATLVFIHGYPFAKEMWEEQLRSLPENSAGLAYDIRGFGNSEAGHRFFSIDLFARDLIALLGVLNVNNAVLCGISMGGYLALRAIEIAPKLFRGIILCDTTSNADSNESKMNRFKGIETILTEGMEVYADSFLKKIFTSPYARSGPALKIREMILATPPEIACSVLLALASRTDTTPVLATINVPCLVIHGAGDQVIPVEKAREMQQQIPGAELVILPDAGHLPNIDQPENFNRQLAGFLRKV